MNSAFAQAIEQDMANRAERAFEAARVHEYQARVYRMNGNLFRRSLTNDMPVGYEDEYEAVDAGRVVDRNLVHAAEQVYSRFQNIDEDRHCPDQGRSLMMGDIVELVGDDGVRHLMQVAMCGFNDVGQVFARNMQA